MARKLKNPLPPISNDTIGKRLADVRKSRGLTQTQLADLIGINQRLVSDYEIGRVGISAEMLARFCMALRCSADTIMAISKELPKEQNNLRFVKRLKRIEQLPPLKQKVLLQTIDGFIKGTNPA